MRRRFRQIDGVLVEYGSFTPETLAPLVMPDIAPYVSMADGSLITSRSRHREHLREHGCVELGNDPSVLNAKAQPIPDVKPQERHEMIRSQVAGMRHDDFKRMLENDLNRIRWQSRDR